MHDVMPIAREPRLELLASPAFELLIGLSALTGDRGTPEQTWVPALADCSAGLRRAIAGVGERAGELWLHLLGLALELPADAAGDFVERLGDVPPLELRRHVAGVHVPAWRTVVGAETLERAARGSTRAARSLLASERYYAGRASQSLARVLPLTPAQTKRTLLEALRRFQDEVFAPREHDVMELLRGDVARKAALARSLSREALITAATRGYVYEPEPEFELVVLAPHVAARPWLLLCQHRTARIICYAAENAAEDVGERALAVGRALADERRIRMLRRLAAGEATLAELADDSGVVKSTAHHHLAQLRDAGLITLRGNARGYWYALRPEGVADARDVLAALVAPH